MGAASRRISSIQALRALAALSVAIAHLQGTLVRLSAPVLPDGFVIGAAGVDLFFVISGFVIVYSSERMFGQSSAPVDFFLRRVARIAPLYFTVTTILLAYFLWRDHGDLSASDHSVGSVIASYLFWPFRRESGSTTPLLSIGWTLNYEMFFYALFAGFVWLSRARAVLCAVVTLAVLIVLGRYQLIPDPYSLLADPIVAEFAYGALIALAYRGGLRLPTAMTVALCAAGFAALAWTGFYGLGDHPRWLAWGIPCAMIVGGLSLARMEPAAPAPLRWLVVLGEASYALYLTHTLTLAVTYRALPYAISPSATLIFSLLELGACIAVALAVHFCFERPVTEYLRSRLARLSAARTRHQPAAA